MLKTPVSGAAGCALVALLRGDGGIDERRLHVADGVEIHPGSLGNRRR
ncbi:MAG TPA: hypothetical protein VM388_04560 [Acidimicrobiales bacterium]|nr:hypothetical protein [Acidimicrobiales bacterium]